VGRATRQPTNTLREREHGSAADRERREMQVDLGAGEEAVGTHRKVWIGRGCFGCGWESVQKDRRTPGTAVAREGHRAAAAGHERRKTGIGSQSLRLGKRHRREARAGAIAGCEARA
jgi:hypothetical protein